MRADPCRVAASKREKGATVKPTTETPPTPKDIHRFRHASARAVIMLLVGSAAVLQGCAVNSEFENPSGLEPRAHDPGLRGPVGGIGIESNDVVSMTDTMVRDMMAMPEIVGRSVAPRVIVDAEHFVNDSAQPINRNVITDRLRVNLNRAARSRLVFVGRNYSQAVALERQLKRSGAVDIGTTGLTKAPAGADFRLGGRITSLDARNPRTGVTQRYNQIVFELVDLETGVLLWTNMYSVLRSAADDVVYR